MPELHIKKSKNQIELFGYDYHFSLFKNLYLKKKLPNAILLSGQKGSGKCTFAYHFINFLLSQNEKYSYSTESYSINLNNSSYIKLCDNTHSNFFLLEKDMINNVIKIDSIRNTLKFLNQTTYSSNIKIILIDGAEHLNKNSSNALLKVLEEADRQTFFFIIHNNSYQILNTIKSRCIEFKLFFNLEEKKVVFNKIQNFYNNNFNINDHETFLYFETPGNILKYLIYFEDASFNFIDDKILAIKHLFTKYKSNKDNEIFPIISLLIELFYNELAIKNIKYVNFYFNNKIKILKKINDSIKFNLDKKLLFLFLEEILNNEKK